MRAVRVAHHRRGAWAGPHQTGHSRRRRNGHAHDKALGGPHAGSRDGHDASGRAGAVAEPSASGEVVKLGFVTKFPVDFFFTLENAAKAWDEAHPEAEVLFAQGQSATDDAGVIAAIEDLVAQGVAGIADHPHERRGHPGARRRHRGRVSRSS